MPCHPDRVRSAPLPDGYQFGDGATSCYFCDRDLTGAVRVTMGETEPLFFCIVCEDCAERPFPLCEWDRTRPAVVPRWRPWHESAAEWSARYAAQRAAVAESAAPILFWNTIEPD